jgi:internalin A
LVTALGVWLGLVVNRVHKRQQAVQAIQKLEGVIHFDHQYDEKGGFHENADLPGPAWLRKAVGDDFFRKVAVIDFASGSGGLKRQRSKVGDDDLRHLEALPGIKHLELSRNRAVTDRGLVHLRSLKNLEALYLHKMSIEGPGLEHIKHLPQLHHLNLEHSPLQDAGLEHIGEMTQLLTLQLGNTNVTDAGVANLVALSDLQNLSLAGADVSDRSVVHLKRLGRLEHLSLSRTNVTAAGVAELKAALPNCAIHVSYGLGMQPRTPPLWPEGVKPTRQDLFAAIQDLGGRAELDNCLPEQPIVTLTFWGSDLSDAAMIRLLEELPDLKHLQLRQVLVGDQLAAYLRDRDQLTLLLFAESGLTDAGLTHLAQLTNLQELGLSGNRISDAGLKALTRLTSLKDLYLSETSVTEPGLIKLQQSLPNCSISF